VADIPLSIYFRRIALDKGLSTTPDCSIIKHTTVDWCNLEYFLDESRGEDSERTLKRIVADIYTWIQSITLVRRLGAIPNCSILMNHCGSDYVLAKSKRQKSNERTKDPEEDLIVAGAGHVNIQQAIALAITWLGRLCSQIVGPLLALYSKLPPWTPESKHYLIRPINAILQRQISERLNMFW